MASIALGLEERLQLEALADARGTTMSALGRQAIVRMLAEAQEATTT